jgi:taurine dioxygenase
VSSMTAAQGTSVSKSHSAATPLEIVRETGTCGASVHGLDLRAELSPEVQQALVRALHEYGVLFVRFEGEIDPEDHKRVARVFGELRESPFNKGSIPLVSVLDSEKVASYRTDQWHTDGTILDEPPRAAALRAVVLPEVGGDTMWASMYAAYATLSAKMQHFLEGLEALHTTEHRAHPSGVKSAVHPVVIRDSVTRKPALYVNSGYTLRIVGLTPHESDRILRMLFDHVNTPDFHVRLKWDTQTIAIWEESVTQHRAVSDYTGRRVLHRVVIKGSQPEAYGKIRRDAEVA